MAVLFKGADKLAKQFTALLIPEVENMLKGIHHRVDATELIEVSLPIRPCVPNHQPGAQAGEGNCIGGGCPTTVETSRTEQEPLSCTA
jgi:hypothetical protein